jgi:hypothetical protein
MRALEVCTKKELANDTFLGEWLIRFVAIEISFCRSQQTSSWCYWRFLTTHKRSPFKRLFMLSNCLMVFVGPPSGNSSTWHDVKCKAQNSSQQSQIFTHLLSIVYQERVHLASGYCLIWFLLRHKKRNARKTRNVSEAAHTKKPFDDWKWLLAPKRESAGRKFIVEFIETKF